MLLYKLPSGDPVHRYEKCIVVLFGGKRRVLSTCPLNGGYRENLTAVFNNDGNPGAGMACKLRAPTYEEHMALVAAEIGLEPETAAGMSTAASMENVSIQSECYRDVTVTAIVTGGIEVNGGRVGDPASWHEENGKSVPVTLGTINVILDISTDLTPGALTRAAVTCTEAKTAALQELLAPSRYSMGIATGSGTDDTIIVCNAESDVRLSRAGKHCKLGELIGRVVKRAVKEALYQQTGLCPAYQHHILHRMDRFGITERSLWERFGGREMGLSRADFSDRLHTLGSGDALVTHTALYAHLLDEVMWGLLSPAEAMGAGSSLLGLMEHRHGKAPENIPESREAALEQMIALYAKSILTLMGSETI